MKKIAILTSGGDCAGLNAAIRAVVHSATQRGWEVYGVRQGTYGLSQEPPLISKLNPVDFDGTIMRVGGTVLGTTNKGNPMDHIEKIKKALNDHGIESVIGIGGDGSFAILKELAKQADLKLVGIPKTIDNDVGETDICVGFYTAVAIATEALDRLQPTAASHSRVMVLEVMGRDAGHIALHAGVAGGADVILIPEIPYDMDAVAAKIKKVQEDGRSSALVVVSEAVKTIGGDELYVEYAGGKKRLGGVGQYIGEQIEKTTGIETRVTKLGYVQRGASPTARDRIVASAFGVHAVALIDEGKFDRMVGWSGRGVIDVPLADAIASYKAVDEDDPLVHTARSLGICLGD